MVTFSFYLHTIYAFEGSGNAYELACMHVCRACKQTVTFIYYVLRFTYNCKGLRDHRNHYHRPRSRIRLLEVRDLG
jgi:hypothetical protein